MSETPFMAQRRKLHELRDKQDAAAPVSKKKAKKKAKKKTSGQD
jgi:hypothetical protein